MMKTINVWLDELAGAAQAAIHNASTPTGYELRETKLNTVPPWSERRLGGEP